MWQERIRASFCVTTRERYIAARWLRETGNLASTFLMPPDFGALSRALVVDYGIEPTVMGLEHIKLALMSQHISIAHRLEKETCRVITDTPRLKLISIQLKRRVIDYSDVPWRTRVGE